MLEYKYQIYVPSGNDTALVFGNNYSREDIIRINDLIMSEHANVEQVGFVSDEPKRHVFFMAGGGFCGNGTRAAVCHFLRGMPDNIRITIPDVFDGLSAGITKNHDVWTCVPLQSKSKITEIEDGFYLVEMIGVTHIIVSPEKSKQFLTKAQDLLTVSKSILLNYNLLDYSSCGVVFQSGLADSVCIHPFVHDIGVDTMIAETACGSGTVATAMVKSYLENSNVTIPVIQPSGHIIKAEIEYNGFEFTKAVISGKVVSDGVIYTRSLPT